VCNYIYHKSLQLTHTLSCNQQEAAACGGSSGSSSSSSSMAAEAADKQDDGSIAAAGASSDAGSSDAGSSLAAQQQQQQQQPGNACESTPCYSLFVHVPSFEAVSEEKQQQFLLALLDSISKQLTRVAAA
jgi:hypothetical protein